MDLASIYAQCGVMQGELKNLYNISYYSQVSQREIEIVVGKCFLLGGRQYTQSKTWSRDTLYSTMPYIQG